MTTPLRLFENGFTDLVCVIPPNGNLAPSSSITAEQIGKVPGLRGRDGLWSGYNWRTRTTTEEDVRSWALQGANIGLRATNFPAVDIDILDPRIADRVEALAYEHLGPAPVRIGRAPKRLLVYRTFEPFTRVRFSMRVDGSRHLVEVLGDGQQYVVFGVHPATSRPYAWPGLDVDHLCPDHLTVINPQKVETFFEALEAEFGWLYKVEVEGTAKTKGDAPPQDSLLAPSLTVLREAVGVMPNTSALFPTRTDYLNMGYAIRAASGAETDVGFEIFAEWAAKWEGNTEFPAGNEIGVVRADWGRMQPPYRLGWGWIAESARKHGFDDAALDFATDAPRPADERVVEPILHSDQWLAQRVVERHRGVLRFLPATGKWLVWDGRRWCVDAVNLASARISEGLREIADRVSRIGATPKERDEFQKLATKISSTRALRDVRALIETDPSVAMAPEALDTDIWILNTPIGIVDLTSGELRASDPDMLCTRSTAAAPDMGGACPNWKRYLHETAGGDVETIRYLQRLAGYALTGSVREEHFTFLWGPGGNGKGTYLDTIVRVMGDYATTVPMDAFIASRNERHSTDIASLQGARLVTASETEEGRRWDEAKVKLLTGGDRVKARFMHRDNFEFKPQFTLIFMGNNKPEIRNLDAAMRRRVHLVPFEREPVRVDKDLKDVKLVKEQSAILGWMIEGCLLWQLEGLSPPKAITDATDDYFADEDPMGRWIDECCTTAATAEDDTMNLYQSWNEWCGQRGEYVGSVRRFSQAIEKRRFKKRRGSARGYHGIRALEQSVDL